MNATAKVIGLDIAKNVFVAVGRDTYGKVVLKRTISRGDMLSTFANMPRCLILLLFEVSVFGFFVIYHG